MFCTESGRPLLGTRTRTRFARYVRLASLDPAATPHTLRHSCATLLASLRVPDRTIMAILGHSSLHIVAKYEHALPEHLQAAAERLQSAFGA